jgi:CopG family transcriptional regulator/antitoxin EndoAI
MNTQTLNIALPEDLVKKADQLAKKEYRNRSELIREALRIYIDRKNAWAEIFEVGEKAAKRMGIKNEEEVNQIVSDYRHGKKTSNRT